ncbi:MAG: hypothetical protein NUW01_04045 [Gemmatimonadaceae bacterium]|nr:hypothetical protein [Gemmatimonadaceae bacterium]
MSNRKPQRTVREGQFDRAMEGFNREMATKTALTMARFHELYVKPLERRIMVLELLTGIRLLRWTLSLPGRIKDWLFITFTEPVPEVAPVPEGTLGVTGAETMTGPIEVPAQPEPEHDGRTRILTLQD